MPYGWYIFFNATLKSGDTFQYLYGPWDYDTAQSKFAGVNPSDFGIGPGEEAYGGRYFNPDKLGGCTFKLPV